MLFVVLMSRNSRRLKKKTFCGFRGYKPVPPGWFKICVGFISGTPEGSTGSGSGFKA